MKRLTIVGGAAALLALAACSAEAPDAAQLRILGSELAQRIEAASAPLVLDVRSEAEFRAGHIPGALNIPHDQLAARLGELPADANDEVVVHCQSGRRAQEAAGVLAEGGYENVRDLDGHWQAWQAAGLPSEAGR